jgi:hypothetical protein
MKPWLLGLVCFVVGLLVVPLVAFVYLDYGWPPVAVADSSFPFERQIVSAPLHRRIDAELAQAPTKATDQSLLAGAVTYKGQCAICHGSPDHTSDIGQNMFPSAPRFGRNTTTVLSA